MLQRIKSKIDRSYRASLYRTGNEHLLYAKQDKADLILMYHNIDLIGDKRFNGRHISRLDFRRHLTYFKKRFDIVPLKDMFNSQNQGGIRIALTFDDGLSNNLKNAVPELEALDIPASFYITCANLQDRSILWPDAINILTHQVEGPLDCLGEVFHPQPWNRWISTEQGELMSFLKGRSQDERWSFIEGLEKSLGIKPNEVANADYFELLQSDQIKTIAQNPLFEIGSHAVSHSNLAVLTTEEQEVELTSSKTYLEDITQSEVASIAFPDGSYTRQSIELAEACGYNHQLAVNYRHEEDKNDPRILDRFGLYNDRSAIEHLHQVNLRLNEEH